MVQAVGGAKSGWPTSIKAICRLCWWGGRLNTANPVWQKWAVGFSYKGWLANQYRCRVGLANNALATDERVSCVCKSP